MRAYLDQLAASRRVICDLLGFGEDVYQAVRFLAAKWCAEPSVHDGKKRPRPPQGDEPALAKERGWDEGKTPSLRWGRLGWA